MWFLGFRKAKLNNEKLVLEIDHIKLDTQRLELEIKRLNEEKEQRDAAKRIESLCGRILDYAKKTKAENGSSDAVAFSEQQLSEQLKESVDAIGQALILLQGKYGQRQICYEADFGTWVLDV